MTDMDNLLWVCMTCKAVYVDGAWIPEGDATEAVKGRWLSHGYCLECYLAELAKIEREAAKGEEL